jgi:hypothetical protein
VLTGYNVQFNEIRITNITNTKANTQSLGPSHTPYFKCVDPLDHTAYFIQAIFLVDSDAELLRHLILELT